MNLTYEGLSLHKQNHWLPKYDGEEERDDCVHRQNSLRYSFQQGNQLYFVYSINLPPYHHDDDGESSHDLTLPKMIARVIWHKFYFSQVQK